MSAVIQRKPNTAVAATPKKPNNVKTRSNQPTAPAKVTARNLCADNTIALFDENLSHHRRLIAIVWRRQRHCSFPRRDASIGGDLVTWTLGLPSAQPKARRKRRKPATFHARAIDCAVDAWSNERSLMERYQCTQQFSKVRNAHARLIEQALLPKPCNRISRGFLHRP